MSKIEGAKLQDMGFAGFGGFAATQSDGKSLTQVPDDVDRAVVDVASIPRLAFYGTANIARWLTLHPASSSIVTTTLRTGAGPRHSPDTAPDFDRSTMSNKGLDALASIASSSQISERGEANTDNGGDGAMPAAPPAELQSSAAAPTPSLGASLNSLTNSLATTQQLQQLLNVAGISQSLQSTATNMNLLGLHQQQQQQPQPATDPALLLSQLSQIAHLQQMFGRSQQPQGMINSLVSNFGGHNQQEMAAGECPIALAYRGGSTESVPHGAGEGLKKGDSCLT